MLQAACLRRLPEPEGRTARGLCLWGPMQQRRVQPFTAQGRLLTWVFHFITTGCHLLLPRVSRSRTLVRRGPDPQLERRPWEAGRPRGRPLAQLPPYPALQQAPPLRAPLKAKFQYQSAFLSRPIPSVPATKTFLQHPGSHAFLQRPSSPPVFPNLHSPKTLSDAALRRSAGSSRVPAAPLPLCTSPWPGVVGKLGEAQKLSPFPAAPTQASP